MELLQLKYFKTAACLEHMTKAAQELHIPQPALSKTIALLEKELGVQLFDRRGKYICLNEYGRVFLRRVEGALADLEDGMRELKDMHNKSFGDVRLSILAGSHTIPELITAFRQRYPYIGFHLSHHFQSSSAIPDYDLCIASMPHEAEDCCSLSLMTEEIFLAVPEGHPFAKRTSIHLGEARYDDFISLKSGRSFRELTDSFCYNAGFAPRIVFESDDPSTVRGLIRAGLGIAFVPAVSWGCFTGSSIILLNIEKPVCRRTLVMSWRKERYLPQAACLFRDFAAGYFKDRL